MRFQGRNAVVTGGSQGIGRTIVDLLCEEGAKVHVFDQREAENADPRVSFYPVDVANPASVDEAVSRLPEAIHCLVNNAGITRDRSLAKMSNTEWQEVIDVNLGGAFNLLRALTPRLRTAGKGRVVNITSINGLRGKFGQANYAASKAGLIGLTKTAAKELGPKGVNVNAVAPGMVLTEMALQLPAEFLESARKEAALPELAEPTDIAHAVLFLLSDQARAITGVVLKVDAGQYI